MRSILNIIAEDTPSLCEAFVRFSNTFDANDKQRVLDIWNEGFGANEEAFDFIKKNPTLIKDTLSNYGIYNTDIEKLSLTVYYAPTVGVSYKGKWEVVQTTAEGGGIIITNSDVFNSREDALAFVAKNMLYREVNWS